MYIMINACIVAEINATEGVEPFFVLNGNWDGIADFKAGVFWAENYPNSKIKIESVRPAIKGEMLPYY